ncbi:MAG: CDP-diacylglycerol--serine O-phosphatidyltransferase [Acidobacteria bacterium]|nr:MAG: CDP-diacylglycerol--serine O-phosphatidyltransferase [Acidobacteriota bacterium]
MRPRDRRFKRGAYLLPTLFTVGNLFCGYFAVVSSFRSAYETAALLIFIAAVLDGLDGRVARMTGSTSEFGKELDSLVDGVSFGVAPAVMIYGWALQPFGRFGSLMSFLFVACGVVRLARFNIQGGSTDKRFFIGLPIPMAALVLSATVTVSPAGPSARWVQVCVLVLTLILSLLMVSKLRYWSFKELHMPGRLPSVVAVAVALAFVAVAIHPPAVILVVGLVYVLSGLMPRALLPRAERRAGAMGETPHEGDGGQ